MILFEGVRATPVFPPRDPLLDKFRDAVLPTGAPLIGTGAAGTGLVGTLRRAG